MSEKCKKKKSAFRQKKCPRSKMKTANRQKKLSVCQCADFVNYDLPQKCEKNKVKNVCKNSWVKKKNVTEKVRKNVSKNVRKKKVLEKSSKNVKKIEKCQKKKKKSEKCQKKNQKKM